jgi:hypothetical protein
MGKREFGRQTLSRRHYHAKKETPAWIGEKRAAASNERRERDKVVVNGLWIDRPSLRRQRAQRGQRRAGKELKWAEER